MKAYRKSRIANRAGFSLVETLVAVAILTTGLTAALSLLSFTLRTVQVTSNALVAAHLAAEGVEVIRNIRDENWLRRDNSAAPEPARSWRAGLDKGVYEVQYDTELPLTVHSDRLLEISSEGRYCYACAGPASPAAIFRRKIEIDPDPLPPGFDTARQLRLRVSVSWTDQIKTREVAVEDILYDWK